MSSDDNRTGVNRREFIARSAGGLALTVLTSCSDGPTIPKSPRIEIVVATFPGLATIGQIVKVGPSHAAKRTGTDTFEAYSMFCTHQGCTTFISAQQFACPCHGSKFGADGSVIQGPADERLASLPTSYNAATDTLTIN